ncbi:MAG: CopD family protein [Pseudomonadota bacterium]|nr:CopD family protein [Pseudomonadota bacterium]
MLLIKTLHIFFMVTWFAGLFYLPRLFVYHAMSSDDTSLKRFLTMERKLLWGITTPGAILTIVFGFWLTYNYFPDYFSHFWMHVKLLLVLFLILYHLFCVKIYYDFLNNNNKKSHKWLRWFNEIPVFLLLSIIALVIYKPM